MTCGFGSIEPHRPKGASKPTHSFNLYLMDVRLALKGQGAMLGLAALPLYRTAYGFPAPAEY